MSAGRKMRRAARDKATAKVERATRIIAIENAAARKAVLTATRQASHDTAERLMAAWTVALHDKFGFGDKRLTQLLTAVVSQAECFGTDGVTAQSVLEQLRRELPRWSATIDALARNSRLVP